MFVEWHCFRRLYFLFLYIMQKFCVCNCYEWCMNRMLKFTEGLTVLLKTEQDEDHSYNDDCLQIWADF